MNILMKMSLMNAGKERGGGDHVTIFLVRDLSTHKNEPVEVIQRNLFHVNEWS